MTEDEKLIQGIRRKRRGALEKAIDLYTPYVGTVIYNVIGSTMTKEDVEEVISDVFISLWRNADKFDGKKGCLRSYLGASARNMAKNKLASLRVSVELTENVAAPYAEPNKRLERDEEREIVIHSINELGEPDSEIFMRYYYYDEKIRNIAKILKMPENTVKTKLARGRVKLKNMLQRRNGNEQQIR
ncbi:MAG: sigma-70 family RNA polymerase sigma factor [Firmicutes bacterium]|nr:sigma-70 family RNA polymerase sigma factor [Bacillota bacterium]